MQTEKYNLDFPVEDSLGNIILRNIKKRKINGFAKVNDNMDITQKWMFSDIFFCGEPLAIRLNNKNGLMAFGNMNITQLDAPGRFAFHQTEWFTNNDTLSFDDNPSPDKSRTLPVVLAKGGVILLNMDDGTVIKYLLSNNLTMGFHTISIIR